MREWVMQGIVGSCMHNWSRIFPLCSLQPGANSFLRHEEAHLLRALGIFLKPFKGAHVNEVLCFTYASAIQFQCAVLFSQMCSLFIKEL